LLLVSLVVFLLLHCRSCSFIYRPNEGYFQESTMPPRTYRRVASGEAEPGASSSTGAGSTDRSLAERFQDKLLALAWVVTASIVCWWSGTFSVIRHPAQSKANVGLLQVVAVLVGVNTILLLYLTVYLPRFKGLTDSSAWEVYCPAVIPSMTGAGVLAFLLAVRATWPVWGFLAPLVWGQQCLGLLFALQFVPSY
jgi:hypothetical protein